LQQQPTTPVRTRYFGSWQIAFLAYHMNRKNCSTMGPLSSFNNLIVRRLFEFHKPRKLLTLEFPDPSRGPYSDMVQTTAKGSDDSKSLFVSELPPVVLNVLHGRPALQETKKTRLQAGRLGAGTSRGIFAPNMGGCGAVRIPIRVAHPGRPTKERESQAVKWDIGSGADFMPASETAQAR